MDSLLESGFLTLAQIIGQDEVTETQAQKNKKKKKGPQRPRPRKRALIPVKKSCWWDGVKSGRFPKPVKIGHGRGAFWRAEDIRALIASAGAEAAK